MGPIALRPGEIGPVKYINNGVYTSEAIAPTGEKFYLACEPLTNNEDWTRYRDNVSYLLAEGFVGTPLKGSLIKLAQSVDDQDKLNQFFQLDGASKFWTQAPEKFDALKQKMLQRKIVSGSSTEMAIKGVKQGINGFAPEIQTHVIYASKSPVLGEAKIQYGTYNGFDSYMDLYGDILMSVGSTVTYCTEESGVLFWKKSYNVGRVENRGIYRNPISIVEGGYGGLAMMLHSFTAMVHAKKEVSVKTFRVRPTEHMCELLLKALPKDQFTVNGLPFAKLPPDFSKNEPDIRVPIEALANLHRQK